MIGKFQICLARPDTRMIPVTRHGASRGKGCRAARQSGALPKTWLCPSEILWFPRRSHSSSTPAAPTREAVGALIVRFSFHALSELVHAAPAREGAPATPLFGRTSPNFGKLIREADIRAV